MVVPLLTHVNRGDRLRSDLSACVVRTRPSTCGRRTHCADVTAINWQRVALAFVLDRSVSV